MPACRIRIAAVVVLGGLLAAGAPPATAQTDNGEWRSYGGDIANTRYSPLDQIDAGNFDDLEVAWRLRTANFGSEPEFNFQATPLMVDGVIYSTAGLRRAAIAADAATGELLWMHRLDEGERAAVAPRRRSGRGLAYRDNGADGEIFYVTPGYRLVGLNAKTGERLSGFGDDGIIDLMQNMDQEIDPLAGEIGLHATPLVAGDTIVVGAAHVPGSAPRSMRNTKGYIRGFDANTGVRKWIFHTIPGADEFGNDSWLNDSWRYTGNTGVWGQISADLELGIVYLPTEMPTNDYYGGHRHGDNLFSDSIVAVDIDTGERLWHLQVIQHDVWDWDFPCAPVLVDVEIDGVMRKLIAQPSKQSWLYVLDRVTGEPIWPIVERPVPGSDTPGEWISPTQPFPTKPAPFDRHGITEDDLIDFTAELRAEALAIAEPYILGEIFTPPSVRGDGPEDTRGTLQLPGSVGGAEWGGAGFDPETGMLYVPSVTGAFAADLTPGNPDRMNVRYTRGTRAFPNGPRGLPLTRPPYGRITAIDMKTGRRLDVPKATAAEPAAAPSICALGNRDDDAADETLLFVSEGDRSFPRPPRGPEPGAARATPRKRAPRLGDGVPAGPTVRSLPAEAGVIVCRCSLDTRGGSRLRCGSAAARPPPTGGRRAAATGASPKCAHARQAPPAVEEVISPGVMA